LSARQLKRTAKDIALEELQLGCWAEPVLVDAGYGHLEDILEAGVITVCKLPKFKVGCRRRLAASIRDRLDHICPLDAEKAQYFLTELDKVVLKYR
jgi:hypothetical protein